MKDEKITPAQIDEVDDSVIVRAVEAFLAALDAEPEKDCWDTETGEEEPGARQFSSDWALTDWHDARDAALSNLRGALAAKSIKPTTADALARLAEIPPVGSEERERWLDQAKRWVFGMHCGFLCTSAQGFLTLMSEARKQGQRDVLGASSTTTEPSPSAEPLRVSSADAASVSSRGPSDFTDELARLSEAATKKGWRVFDRAGVLEIQRKDGGTIVHWAGFDQLTGTSARKRVANAEFIVALVNAYRAGELVPVFAAAKPSGGWRPIETAPKDGTWVWAEWPEIKQATKTKSKAPRIVAPAFYGRPDPQDHYMPHWCLNGRWTPGDGPARWFPMGQPPASADEHPQDEDPQGAESRSDASAVGEAETPEATPSISPPPSPRKGQEENPRPMTVEEARALLDGVRDPKALADYYRNMGAIDGSPWQKRVWFGHAESIELALSTIRASEEDR